MFKFRGISAKLFFLVLIPIIGLALVGAFSYFSLQQVRKQFDSVTQVNIPQKAFSAEIKAHIPEVISFMQRAALSHKDADIRAKSIEKARFHMEKVRANQVELLELKNEEALKAIIEKFNGTLDEFEGQQSMILDQLEAGSEEALKNAEEALKATAIQDAQTAVNASISALDSVVSEDLKTESAVALNKIAELGKIILAVIVCSLLISFTVTILFVRNLIKQIENLKSNIKTSAESTQKQSLQLNESANVVATGSTQSAAALQESAASVEEILSMTKKNNESAKLAEELATSSLSTSEKGQIQNSELIKRMHDLRESYKKIEGITEVIDDLAFQTNLLALNASVEAARAGEQGRGFAVVAEAVRSLANKSSSSAKEISELISTSTQLVQSGQADAQNSGVLLKEIVVQNQKVKNLIVEIASASNEQEISLNQVSQAITVLDQNAQTNASSSQQVSSSSSLLLDESKTLFDQITNFETLIDGKKKAA
jgi:hypothetical protein